LLRPLQRYRHFSYGARFAGSLARPYLLHGFDARHLDEKFRSLPEFRKIKSPNSGSRTPRNSQKTKNGAPLKSPKFSLLPNRFSGLIST
jgi:hypothetical protein